MKTSTFLRILAGFFCLSALWVSSCTDPTDIGGELLEGDLVRVKFTDTIKINAFSEPGDTLTLYFPLSNFNQVEPAWLGSYEDPFFGKVSSSAYVQPRLQRSGSGQAFVSPSFANEGIDSIVLVLPYSTTPNYGPLTEQTSLEVYRVTEQMDRTVTYNSDDDFVIDQTPITTYNFQPNTDSTFVLNYFGENVDTVGYPQIRIPLPNSLGTELIGLDSLDYVNDSTWLDKFPGLYIKQSNTTKGLQALDLSDGFPERGGIFVYYSRGPQDSTDMYQFPINGFSVRSYNFEHDYTGSPVANLIGQSPAIDTAVAVQGMEGVNTVLSFDGLDALKGFAINNAELEVFVIPTGDEDDYPLPAAMTLLRKVDDELTLVDDYLLVDFNLRTLVFGGTPQEQTDGPVKYTFKISRHLQEMINGDEPNELYLRVSPKATSAGRALLYGPKHSSYPMRLKVTYTEY